MCDPDSQMPISMLSQFVDVSEWTAEQWLAACILAFIVVTVLVVLHRSVKLFQLTSKQKYQPNLRPLRRTRVGSSSAQQTDDS